ncbi:hypothetical protein FIM12_01015 [SAR202 cluster bacterium AD-804-J14_MRT_500m]|nr:hypothetical protein [SAR202 cluster bacterium AD-804-J14_MRT_500m]
MVTVGTGAHIFKLSRDWGNLPNSIKYGAVSAIATDSQNHVYIFQRTNPPVLVLDETGEYLGSWGDKAITEAHGIYISNDIVYLTDRDDSVALKYTLDGKPLLVLGQRGVHSDTGCEKPGDLVPRAAGPFNFPTEMVPSPSGDLYVSDGYRNARVHRFSQEGQLISSWGQPGKIEPGHFHLPHSLLVDNASKIYVCDRENSRIQVFDEDGNYLCMWTDIHRPTDISIDGKGIFYVSELAINGSNPRISVLNSSGVVITRWDSRSAHGLWVDSNGDIYLALVGDKSVDKYIRQG